MKKPLPSSLFPLPSSLFPLPFCCASRNRRGSALLIVLGMLAFMVISAVAFSAYMRYSRLPSSYLRRSSASRLLAKAALAEAIDEIDAAIGNNPHPGIGSNAYTYNDDDNSRRTGTSKNRNTWKNRIYIGSTSLGGGNAISGALGQNTTSSSDSGFVDPDQTVSTLTLEGLAYIPPAFVNDARYYSRRSKAGQWKNLAFDSGRYAFCAIDVSDCLNINALMADVARAGSADRRISLAYLFENEQHTSASGSNGSPSNWDSFMANFSGSGKVPLVSLADFNLALWDKQPGGWTSVFCDYVKNGKTSYYGGIGSESAEADKIRRQAFITDSYFPEGDAHAEHGGEHGGEHGHLDLDEEECQPFTKGELRANKSLIQVADENLANQEAFEKFEQCINGLGFCQLYDYLDQNSEPLSLAIPTVERVPMICGLSPEMQSGALTVEAATPIDNKIDPDPSAAQPGQDYTITLQVKYTIKGLPTAPTKALVVYPFRHEEKQGGSFEVGGRMAYFLTVEGEEMGLRTKNANDILHVGYSKDVDSYKAVDDAVLAVGFRPQSVSPSTFNPGANGPEGAVKAVSLTPNGIIPTDVQFLDVTYVGKGKFVDNGEGKAMVDPNHSQIKLDLGDVATQATCSWKPLTANGAVSPAFAASLLDTLNNAGSSKKFKVNLAVWAWVKDTATGRIVDMTPACVYDDADLNARNNDNRSKMWGQQRLGAAYPVMRFDMAAGGASLLEFNPADAYKGALKASTGGQLAVTPASVMVCDPRFNHAPESWFQVSGSLSENTWLDGCECGYKTSGAKSGDGRQRDGDIFMSVSDNEELQSVFELANLMRFTDFYRSGTKYGSKNLGYLPPDNKNYTSFPANAADTANFNYMWRTYDPFDGDDFEGVGIHASCEGYKLTPYSTQTNVMMAAFANTPHEWRLSSANEQTMSSVPDDSKGFNQKYAWNAYSSGAKIEWEDLEELCGAFMEEMRLSNGTKDWEDVWADLDWVDFNKTGEERSKHLLSDLQLTDTSSQGRIYNCDRKFLYGFWHDCFALKQQLFLVFVRAEPTMMGGGGVKQTPPALGARAVALVWRDPTKSSENNGPHQTRVLFYRQFD